MCVIIMENKELDQLLCDYFTEAEEIAVNARWLQSELKKIAELQRIIKTIKHKNELLQTLALLQDTDIPKYRLNIKG